MAVRHVQVEGCRANVVTFNTLVDVYGKLGRWQDAVGVLEMLNMQVGLPLAGAKMRLYIFRYVHFTLPINC